MSVLEPEEMIEYLDAIIESLPNYDECYAAIDVANQLREEIIDSLDLEIEEE